MSSAAARKESQATQLVVACSGQVIQLLPFNVRAWNVVVSLNKDTPPLPTPYTG